MNRLFQNINENDIYHTFIRNYIRQSKWVNFVIMAFASGKSTDRFRTLMTNRQQISEELFMSTVIIKLLSTQRLPKAHSSWRCPCLDQWSILVVDQVASHIE